MIDYGQSKKAKPKRTYTVKTILTLLGVFLSYYAIGLEDITLRLNPSFYDESTQTVYVDVELRYNGYGNFRLADQNYRLFYDSELLKLEQDYSRSDLPQDLYSPIQFMEIMEGIEADQVNQLNFDDHLGFINFNIDLNNDSEGGISIQKDEHWHRVAVLNFKVEDKDALSQIVWSRTDATDDYATAFVEIMEWVSPNKTTVASINDYVDASFNVTEEEQKFSVEVSPNPSSDFIKLSFEADLAKALKVNIYDTSGKAVMNSKAYRGAATLNLAIAKLAAGSYTIELTTADTNQRVSTASFIKVN